MRPLQKTKVSSPTLARTNGTRMPPVRHTTFFALHSPRVSSRILSRKLCRRPRISSSPSHSVPCPRNRCRCLLDPLACRGQIHNHPARLRPRSPNPHHQRNLSPSPLLRGFRPQPKRCRCLEGSHEPQTIAVHSCTSCANPSGLRRRPSSPMATPEYWQGHRSILVRPSPRPHLYHRRRPFRSRLDHPSPNHYSTTMNAQSLSRRATPN